MKPLEPHNHLIHVKTTHHIDLVQDLQDPHFRQISKVEILDFSLQQQSGLCLQGTSKQLEGEEWCTITFCRCYCTHTCYLYQPFAWLGFERLTFHFTLCFSMFPFGCLFPLWSFTFHPFAVLLKTFPKLLPTLLALLSFALLAFLSRFRISLFLFEFVNLWSKRWETEE